MGNVIENDTIIDHSRIDGEDTHHTSHVAIANEAKYKKHLA